MKITITEKAKYDKDIIGRTFNVISERVQEFNNYFDIKFYSFIYNGKKREVSENYVLLRK